MSIKRLFRVKRARGNEDGFIDGESGGSGDEKGEKRVELMNIGYVILPICILILFACAPTKVKVYPKSQKKVL